VNIQVATPSCAINAIKSGRLGRTFKDARCPNHE
jgi:hypothetical protein